MHADRDLEKAKTTNRYPITVGAVTFYQTATTNSFFVPGNSGILVCSFLLPSFLVQQIGLIPAWRIVE
jgi:hypothetical protein